MPKLLLQKRIKRKGRKREEAEEGHAVAARGKERKSEGTRQQPLKKSKPALKNTSN